ncbi:MAG TPA: hypothetical protein VGB99_13260 [Acidobacteriota bacterium]
MRKSLHWLGAAFAIALLLGSAAAWAGEMEGEEASLSGLLSTDGQGSYQLTDQASGNQVVLRGSADFDSHVGSTVKVFGEWIEGEDGSKIFEVSRIEPAESTTEQ